jgi:BolA family transcriptional regulator, general stress-responsive regulator
MTITDTIRDKLSALKPESVELLDESGQHIGHEGAKGGGGHYQLIIVSPAFANQPLQSRHRMVYDALGGLMHKQIHALAIKAYAPDEI